MGRPAAQSQLGVAAWIRRPLWPETACIAFRRESISSSPLPKSNLPLVLGTFDLSSSHLSQYHASLFLLILMVLIGALFFFLLVWLDFRCDYLIFWFDVVIYVELRDPWDGCEEVVFWFFYFLFGLCGSCWF